MIAKIVDFIFRKRMAVLGIIGAITLGFLYFMMNINIATNYDDQLPTNHPIRAVHEQYKDKLGGSHMVLVMLKVKKGDVWNIPTLKKIKYMQEYLDAIPGVNHYQVNSLASPRVKQVEVTSGGGLSFKAIMADVPQTEQEVEILARNVHLNDAVYGPMIAFNNQCALLTANFIEGSFSYDEVFSMVNKLVAEMNDEHTEAYAAGEPMLTGWIFDYRNETVMILFFTFGVMILLLFLNYRNWTGVAVPMTAAFVSAIWGLGFCGLLGFSLDPLILVIPLLCMAITISHSVQMCQRYFELLDEFRDKEKAGRLAMQSILPPGMLGLITDIGGMACIAVAPIPLLQKLAVFCGFWIASIVVSVMILCPLLFQFFPVPKNLAKIARPDKTNFLEKRVLGSFGFLATGRSAYGMVGLGVVMFVAAVWVTSKMNIGDIHPGSPILWPDSTYNVAIKNINENFAGTEELFFIVEGKEPGLIRQPDIQRKIRECQIYMEESEMVGFTLSIADFAPVVNKIIHAGDPKWEVIPEDAVMMGSVMNVVIGGSAPGDFDRMMSRDHKDANIVVWCKDHQGDTIRQVLARARSWIAKNKDYEPLQFRLASGYLGILGAVNEVVAQAQAQNIALILGIVVVFAAFTYRSLLAAAILVFVLLLGNFLTMVFMVLKGISLNVNTIPVASIGIGVGVDYSIYILSRIIEEYQLHRDLRLAIPVALRTTGKAVVFTAVTLAGGVILWYFLSSLRFQAEMGLLLALVLLINMVLTLVLLPSIIFVLKPKFIEKGTFMIREKAVRD
ncbi:MAG: MMPL family transporter [Deltaproteobacteria bacterium]|nr:MMPL family transporter [Deltaproteobacteria bacterium]